MVSAVTRYAVILLILSSLVLCGLGLIKGLLALPRKNPNTLVVGLVDDSPPFCYYDETNQLVGMNVELANQIGTRLGKHVRVETSSFNRVLSGLITHQFDMAVIGSITPERQKVVRFTQPYMTSQDVLLVWPALARFQQLSELSHSTHKVGVYNGTSYIKLLKDIGLAENMVIYPNQRDLFMAFFKHKVDAMIMNLDVAGYLQTHYVPNTLILPKNVREGRAYGFALNPDNPKLLKQVNMALSDMYADGTMDQIYHHWRPAVRRAYVVR